MTPELMYAKATTKANKNASGGNIAWSKSSFVLIFNECKNRWVETLLKDKDTVLIDSLQEVIKTEPLQSPVIKDEYYEYALSSDFYEGILIKCKASKGNCKGVLYSREVKNQNKNILQFYSFQKPDFEFEWTFHSIQGNKVRIYRLPEFKITSATFEYYSVIPDIQMIGTVDINGNPITTSIGITLSDQYVDQIINLAVEEFMRNSLNNEGLQIAKDRTISQE